MKKALAILLAAALCLGVMSGCGSAEPAAESPAPTDSGNGGEVVSTDTPTYKYDELYQALPFADCFPLEDGEILIDGEAKQITIGFVQTALNHPWRIAMNESLEAQCERFPNVDLIILDGEADPAKQANCVDDRSQGFYDAIAEYPDIKVIASGDAAFLREPASTLMDDYLVAYDDIDAVYSHAEESAWGSILSIERAGRTGDGIKQYTIDASNEGFRSVESGEFAADGNYTPYIGQVAVRAVLYLLRGETLEGTESYDYGTRFVLPEMPLVTPDNVSEWLGQAWGE